MSSIHTNRSHPTQVTVTIPATTANLGPGFDCLGMALGLYNDVTFTAVPDGPTRITVAGVDVNKVPTDEKNLVLTSAHITFARLGVDPIPMHIHQHNNVPVSSGLGSSSTAVLAGMFGANALVDGRLTPAEMLQMATQLEGHPDNVAPAVHGGLILGLQTAQGLHVECIPTPPLTVVVVLPNFALLTAEARAALPAHISLTDAIFNSGRVGLLVRALADGDYERMAIAMQDRLHQPYRLPLIPGAAAALTAAQAAGARAVALSGAGPSVIAFAPDRHEAIRDAMTAAFAAAGLDSRAWILPVSTQGIQVRSER